jgi:hypothetical protein
MPVSTLSVCLATSNIEDDEQRHTYPRRNPPHAQRTLATMYLLGTSTRSGGKVVPRAILPGDGVAMNQTEKMKESKRQIRQEIKHGRKRSFIGQAWDCLFK